MRAAPSRTLLPLLFLFCVPALSQQVRVVRIGVALFSSSSGNTPAAEARDELVDDLNHHQIDRKLNILMRAVPLDSPPGSPAIAEGRDKKCEFVLYVRLKAWERSSRSGQQTKRSSQNAEANTALLEYQLKSVTDGAPYSIGTAKSAGSDSSREAILDAISRIPNKLVADLGNPSFGHAAGPGEAWNAKPSASTVLANVSERDSCSWLPKNIPHHQALRGVCDYAVTQPEKMPNFICQQETSRYRGNHRVPTDLISATIRYVDGEEYYSEIKKNGKPLPDAMWNTAGLWSSGQLEGNLRDIFNASNRAVFEFSGENKMGEHVAWVFTYQIARQYEPLWELRSGDQLAAPPYEGELWVDQKTGSVLRFRSTAKDILSSFPVRSAEILTDYGDVTFPDGTDFVLPVKSTVVSRSRQEPLIRNVLEFRGCRKFHVKARMVLDASDAAPNAGFIATTIAELETELEENESLYAIMREEEITRDDAQFELEQRRELNGATGQALWKLAQLNKQREKVLAARAKSVRSAAKIVGMTTSGNTTTFQVSVKLVPVSIVVRDKSGHVVGSLKQDDFQLFDSRKEQNILSFSVEKNAAEDSGKRAANDVELDPEAPQNNVAYVFDDLHAAFEDLAHARSAAEKHLTGMRPQDHVAIFTTSAEIALDFTTDQEKIRAALRGLRTHVRRDLTDCPPMSYYVADLILNQADPNAMDLAMEDAADCTFSAKANSGFQQQGQEEKARQMALAKAFEVASIGKVESDRTLTVLNDVFNRAAAMPGRRSIVLLSPGFLTLAHNAQAGAMSIIERAVKADVVFNTLDVHGLASVGLAPDHNHINKPAATFALGSEESAAQNDVLADLAYGTGGIFFHNNNDLEEGLRRASDAPEYVYVVGFAPQRLDGKFHKLKIAVKRPEKLTVQARPGYYALKPSSAN